MGERSSLVSLIALVVITGALASCDGKGQAIASIETVAPAEIAPGESIQLKATAVKRDGSKHDVSRRVQWYSEVPDILELGSSGFATGRNLGEVFVTARFEGRSATSSVFVLPKGRYRLTGTAHELDAKVPGVNVTVLSGVGEGLSSISSFDGSFALYGVSGRIRLQLKKPGYISTVKELDVTGHGNVDFAMKSEREHPLALARLWF